MFDVGGPFSAMSLPRCPINASAISTTVRIKVAGATLKSVAAYQLAVTRTMDLQPSGRSAWRRLPPDGCLGR